MTQTLTARMYRVTYRYTDTATGFQTPYADLYDAVGVQQMRSLLAKWNDRF